MTHSELELQVDAYLDGELAAQDARELEAHLKECRDCSHLRDSRLALGTAIRAEVPAFRAPDERRYPPLVARCRAGGCRSRWPRH